MVLVIEDDDATRELLADSLIEVGYGVMTAASAEVALQLLDVEAPDLVLSDVHMRGMSGIELCASLILTAHPPRGEPSRVFRDRHDGVGEHAP